MGKVRLFLGLMLAGSYGAFAGATTNLLTNPGAETGSTSGWTAACTPSGCSPPSVDSGTFDTGIDPHSGTYDFLGDQSDPDGTLTQSVTIVGTQGITAEEINSGQMFAHVSFWEQGLNQGEPSDSGQITLTFLNAANAVIGTAATVVVDSHDGSWQQDIESFRIPPNTTTIQYTMNFIRNQGSDNDAFIDDNFLSVSSDRVALGMQTDFHGAGLADYTVWRPSTGYWYSRVDEGTSYTATPFGASTDLPVTGDFDGDGKSDLAVFRPSTGYWYITQSSNSEVLAKQWGASTDIPVSGDFDGDGKTDIAVWRPSTGYWYIVQSSNGQVLAKSWGASSDTPVVGDFDGDGKSDIAVWRPSTGYWYIVQSSNGQVLAKSWGASTDIPVSGDFDGDGKADLAVYRPSNGNFYIIQSSNGEVVVTQLGGASGDIPFARDFDGDGKSDVAVYRPSGANTASGTWYWIGSSHGGLTTQAWGASNDVPVDALTR